MKSFKYQCFLALLVAVVLLFSACSPGPATSPPSSSGAVEEQSPEVSSGTEAGGYPIVGEKITLTFLDACHVMQGDNSQLPLWKRMEELTNIHINLEVAPYSNAAERIQLRMSSTTMPDAIFGENIMSDSQLSKYSADGSLLKLNDMLDTYAPNLMARLEEFPELKGFITLPDGGIYGLPFYDSVNGLANEIIAGVAVNTTWLDKLGLDIPETYDEFEKMLYAFKSKDPNGNGIQDEIPFVSHPNANTLFNDFTLFSSLGIQTLCSWGFKDLMCMQDGKVAYVPATEEYKYAITYLHRWYQDGLIEPENASISPPEIDAKLKIEPDIYGAVQTQTVQNLMSPDKIDIETGDYQLIPPLKGPDGQQYVSKRVTSATRVGAVITTDCQYPEECLRWFDYFYGEEGGLYACYGEPGIVWDYNDDGAVEALKPADPTIGYDHWWRSNSVNVPGIIPKDSNVLMRESWKLRYLQMQKLEPYATLEFTWPQLVFSPEESNTISLYEQDLLTYVQQSMAHFVMDGDADIEAEWDDYLKNLKSLGLDTLLETYQNRYDQDQT